MYTNNEEDGGVFAGHDDHDQAMSSDAEDVGPLGSPTRISYAASAASSSTLSVPTAHGSGFLGTPAVGSTRVGMHLCAPVVGCTHLHAH